MRVAYLINQYPKTSHTFIRREIQALERAGVEIVRLSIRGWDDPLVEPADFAERQKTRYVLRSGPLPLLISTFKVALTRPVLFVRAFILAFRMGWRAERALPFHFVYFAEACLITDWLQSEAVEHLHAHFGTNSAEVAMLIHELGGPSWSFTVHGPEEFDKSDALCLPEKLRRSSFAVAVSSYGRSQLFRLVDRRLWSKIYIVHCGLDHGFFNIPGQALRSSLFRFVCVGRLCEQKGQLILLDAAVRLKAMGKDFELVLAGDGEMRSDIEKYLIQQQLQSTVRITGWIDGATVRQELLDASALVLPSFAEGLPVVIMEAMALRRPVISTYVAGIPELVRNIDDGWLVPAGDVDALVEAMEQCLACDEQQMRDKGNAARARVLARHNVETSANYLIGLFQSFGKVTIKH